MSHVVATVLLLKHGEMVFLATICSMSPILDSGDLQVLHVFIYTSH